MKKEDVSSGIVVKLMFRLLPIQILLCLIGSVNGVVSSLFAGNALGPEALSAIGLFSPISMLAGAVSTMLVGGSQILCGKYLGKNLVEKMQNVFSLDIALSSLCAALFMGFMLVTGFFDLTGFIAADPNVRPSFNQYMIGQSIGMLPLFLGSQLAAFLSLENQMRRTTIASIVCIITNLCLNYLFVILLKMNTMGVALSASLSQWVFFALEAKYFFSSKATLRFSVRGLRWRESREIASIGLPGAIGYGYQTIRSFAVNSLLVAHVGSVGLSAFTASNTLLSFAWTIPGGMLAVSRMLFSISVGEEDRETLIETMRTAMRRYLPLMCAVSALLILLAVPLTRLYYRDPSDPVYGMTVSGFRILPACMPFAVICMHFTCYGQVSKKQLLVHILAAVDGVVCVAAFTAILIPHIGMNSVYWANVLNGIVTTIIIVAYAWIREKSFPTSIGQLMVIPEGFGVSEQDRISLSLRSMDDVIRLSQKIQAFCLDKGVDKRRSYLAGLCMEEMAGNVVTHGFSKDNKHHSVDVRAVYKDGGLILRIKDDCVAFDPATRREIVDPEDITKNIGIRMVYDMAYSVSYQSMLGLNVLTVVI